jgi:hypothetical protein
MSAPALTVYTDGGASVTGDGLNTFEQTANTMADLRGFVGIDGVQVFVRGTAAPNDGGQGAFYWNSNGTAPDDNGVTTVVPYGSGSGEWTRLRPRIGVRSNILAAGPLTTVSATFVMLGLGQAFTPQSTGGFLFLINGEFENLTVNDSAELNIAYGSGAPPNGGAAPVGTVITSNVEVLLPSGGIIPFALTAYVGGLTIGSPYWLDMQFSAPGGGTAQLANMTVTIIEL